MEDDDVDGVWMATATLPAGTGDVLFKYRNTNAAVWTNQESVPSECGYNTWSERKVQVADQDITLDTVRWGACDNEAPGGGDSGGGDSGSSTEAVDNSLDATYPGFSVKTHWSCNNNVATCDTAVLVYETVGNMPAGTGGGFCSIDATNVVGSPTIHMVMFAPYDHAEFWHGEPATVITDGTTNAVAIGDQSDETYVKCEITVGPGESFTMSGVTYTTSQPDTVTTVYPA
jgi:hypothetical protein